MSVVITETMGSEAPVQGAHEYMIPTRDGFRLATDVYLPKDSGEQKYSAILSRTCYDKSSQYTGLKYEAETFNSRGFVYVAQDVRGKFRSTGPTEPYTYDVDDAYDTVAWICQQPWSNGKIGATGASYYGFTAWATVACGHPAVQAAIPQVTGIDMSAYHVAPNISQTVPWMSSLNDVLQIWSNNNGYLAAIDYTKPVDEIIADSEKTIGPSIAAKTFLDRTKNPAWYNPYGDRHPYYNTNIPILHWQSWYDPGLCPPGMKDWRHFRSLSATRGLHYLRVASEDHSGYRLAEVGKGAEASAYFNEDIIKRRQREEYTQMADFFDEHLNNVAPVKPRPVALWQVGHLGWQVSQDWPPAGTQNLTFYLSDNKGQPTNKLSADKSHGEGLTSTWTHDPENPVPATHDIESLWYLLMAYPDERDHASRDDVLTFASDALSTDVVLAGQPVFSAHITYPAATTHLFTKLQDVYPDGTTRPISWSANVLQKRAGNVVRITMDDNAYLFRSGHRIQLQICCSNFPHAVVHPGNDENPFYATEKVKALHTIRLGGVDGATLDLPTVEVGTLKTDSGDCLKE